MLALSPFGTVTTAEASQRAELSNAKPCGGEGNVCKKSRFLNVRGIKGSLPFRTSLFSLPLFSFVLSYSCHVCGFETELNVQFVSHMSLHVDKEQWMFSICCTACDFVTMEEAEIKAHVGTKHTGDPPCRSCSRFSPPSVPAHLADASSPCDTNIPFLRRQDPPTQSHISP